MTHHPSFCSAESPLSCEVSVGVVWSGHFQLQEVIVPRLSVLPSAWILPPPTTTIDMPLKTGNCVGSVPY